MFTRLRLIMKRRMCINSFHRSSTRNNFIELVMRLTFYSKYLLHEHIISHGSYIMYKYCQTICDLIDKTLNCLI